MVLRQVQLTWRKQICKEHKSSWFSPKDPPISSVLLAIQGNINYDDDYGYVIVKNLNNINYYLQNRKEQFSDKEVSRLVGRVKGDITK